MNLNHLSLSWSIVAAALGDHLWQSTLFAAAAGSLTLFLRKNHARARYGLWLAASVKFLVPFSLLVSIGKQLAWSHRATGVNAEIYFSVERFSQPFSQSAAAASTTTTLATFFSSLNHLAAVSVVVVWFCGFAAVLFTWAVRWRRISNSIRQAVPLEEGREIESLRNVARATGVPLQIPLLVSDNSLEPGIFGIVRPILVWPHGISDRLEDAHLESILAHELCHMRRRDNLAAAIHMAVEAIFWFHPLVWWLGHRLVTEREFACDEAVLEMGSERQVYAESILKICEFCVGSPLNCVSGVTGADLKKRIAHIMTEDAMHGLGFSKKLLLGAAGLTAIGVPLVFGLLNTTQTLALPQAQTANVGTAAPAYENSYIKINQEGTEALKTGGIIHQRLMINPGEFNAENSPLQDLLRFAYGVEYFQIGEIPAAFHGKLLNVEAKSNSSVKEAMQKLDENQRQLQSQRMLQAILENHLHLKIHRETRNLPAFTLSATKSEKLQEVKVDCDPSVHQQATQKPSMPLTAPCGTVAPGLGILVGNTATMKALTNSLSSITGRMVVDKTNLVGKYNMELKWNPDPNQYPEYGGPRPQADPNGSTLEVALQQQLGLKLEPQTTPVEVLVIDHADLPADN